jgi:hypothetical protein
MPQQTVSLTVEFVAYLYAWNGASETGPVLYASSPKTTTTVPGAERFDFSRSAAAGALSAA